MGIRRQQNDSVVIVGLLSDMKQGNRSFCDKSTKLGRNTRLDELVNLRYGGFSDIAYFASTAHVKNCYCMKTRLNKKIAF